MGKTNENDLHNKEIEKIKYYINYEINETPKYKPVIDDNSVFDEVPVNIHATQDGQPMPNTGGSDAYLEEDDPKDELPAPEGPREPVEPSNAPAPMENDIEDDVDKSDESNVGDDKSIDTSSISSEENVDQIQNDIIKHNINAMKNIHSKLEDLENLNQQLESQLKILMSKVKEVEEPTNAEKLISKKNVSYPFYFNLSDFWKGNWFDQHRNELNEKGIHQLPDGTFIADFDDLPINSSMDIEDSFNSII